MGAFEIGVDLSRGIQPLWVIRRDMKPTMWLRSATEWTADRAKAWQMTRLEADHVLADYGVLALGIEAELAEPVEAKGPPTKWVIYRQTEGGQQFYSRWFGAWTEPPWTNDAACATEFATDEDARVEARDARLVAWKLACKGEVKAAPPALGPDEGYVIRRGDMYLLPGTGSPMWGSLATARRMTGDEAEAALKDAHTFTDRENRQRTWNGQDDLPYPKLMAYWEAKHRVAKVA